MFSIEHPKPGDFCNYNIYKSNTNFRRKSTKTHLPVSVKMKLKKKKMQVSFSPMQTSRVLSISNNFTSYANHNFSIKIKFSY